MDYINHYDLTVHSQQQIDENELKLNLALIWEELNEFGWQLSEPQSHWILVVLGYTCQWRKCDHYNQVG